VVSKGATRELSLGKSICRQYDERKSYYSYRYEECAYESIATPLLRGAG
jgi:hypothetical protein